MKVFKIMAAGYVIGIVVNESGSFSPDDALQCWNTNNSPNYQGDSSEWVTFVKG